MQVDLKDQATDECISFAEAVTFWIDLKPK